MKHKYDGKWDPEKPELKTCNPSNMKYVTEKDTKQEVKDNEEIIFTYDVVFKVCTPSGFSDLHHHRVNYQRLRSPDGRSYQLI